MKFDDLRMKPGRDVDLSKWKAGATPGVKDEETAAAETAERLARMEQLQFRLYAEGRRSLLIVLQGMDTSGKDGVVRRVMTGFDPLGVRVKAFKVPSEEERAHDFLWRVHQVAPAAGEVVIFNRSHYEDVLVVRVHGLVPKAEWSARYALINAFEQALVARGTTVLKFFLHISRGEQRERLLERLDDPAKRWKFNAGDLDERALWKDYRRAYEDALSKCSTKASPWWVIPADRKWYRDWAIARVVTEALESIDPQLPAPELDVKALRARLTEEG